MPLASLFSDFMTSVLANIIGGTVVAAAVYFLIERRFRLREQREKRAETAEGILRALAGELEYNRRVADAFLEHLPKGALPYSGFELSGWVLVSQVPAFTALSPTTVSALLDAYLRTRSANEQHALLFDLTYGSTGALSFIIAGASATQEAKGSFQRLEQQRDDLTKRLLARVDDLRPRIGVALAEVRSELSAGEVGAGGANTLVLGEPP